VDEDSEEEFGVCQKILPTSRYVRDIPEGQRVICRYSALPFYKDLEQEIIHAGSRMVHSHKVHDYIATMGWVTFLRDLTFPTWFDNFHKIPETEHGYVVKGRTNSRKFDWNRRMFAKDHAGIQPVMERLMDDYMIASQGLVVREYKPLRKVGEGINGLPITNEWRLFFLDGQYLTGAFYWSIIDPPFDPSVVPGPALALGQKAVLEANLDNAFVVVDVAEDREGRWWVVELNDGQMSGLSFNDPGVLYRKIKEVLA
jgi:hypothetical protein